MRASKNLTTNTFVTISIITTKCLHNNKNS